MLKITEMKESDVNFATELTRIEKWGYKEKDLRRLIYFEPEGCFIAWKNEERVGMVTTTSYGDYAFLGCLIVRKEERGGGLGTKLMEHAINVLKKKGVKTIELDGVFPAVSLYRRLKFKDKYLSLRFMRKATGGNVKRAIPKHQYNDEELLSEIVNFDREKTGLKRERILKRFLEEFKDSVYIVRNERLSAYAILREREGGFFTVGPLIAESVEGAGELLLHIVSDYENEVLTIGVPEVNSDIVDLLLKKGFIYNHPALRMYIGEKMDYEKCLYGILAPEKG